MAVFKCKMCGGDLEIAPGASVAECQYCGSKQTLPRMDSDRKRNLYDRANHFRRNNEYDKAEGIYEQILNEDPSDAEAYWSLVLCRYGIEYVEDPGTRRRVPTVNRAQYTSVYADENYKKALEYADTLQRGIYEAEAKAIDTIQKGILEISEKEEPFDVFICYKETDPQGRRTPDSVLANELYHELTKEGFKVFFSRITLEDKLGTAYEPYIFAALNSARVMVALGTKPEYFNAVWVKNEWSRYLALIRGGARKTLIPAYRDMDPYDLPEEFSHLQAQDMSKLGFMQDLIRGIRKVLQKDDPKETVKETVVVQQSAEGANLTAQLKRGQQALEDRDWAAADGFFDKALDMDAECAEAFFGKALAAAECIDGETLVNKRIAHARPEKEELPAYERDDTCIKDALRKYTIPAYFPGREITKLYSFGHRSITSYTKGWEKLVIKEEDYWNETDRNLSRALRYARGETAQKYQELRAMAISALEAKCRESKASDSRIKEETARLYAEHLETASEKVVAAYKRAIQLRRQNYESYCRNQGKATSAREFTEAATWFEREGMQGYEDSDERAAQCRAEAARLDRQEKGAAAEKKIKEELASREQMRQELEAEIKRLRGELVQTKGLFAGKKKRELEDQIAKAESELHKL